MSFLHNTTFLRALYAGNMLWHTSAFIHFSHRAPFMMRKLSTRRLSPDPSISTTAQGDPWHHDIMAYLGYINVGYAVLAGARLYHHFSKEKSGEGAGALSELDVLALAVLGVANASQAWGNFVLSRGSGRWIMGSGWDRITVLDALFTLLDGAAVAAHILAQ